VDRLRGKADAKQVPSRFDEPGCIDPSAGRRLISYSLGRLSPAEELDFEVHLIECDHCFDALRGLDQIETILNGN